MILNAGLYRTELVPRWLSLWGFVGVVLAFLYGLIGILTSDVDIEFRAALLAAPIAIQEMVFAFWLLIKGFDTTTPASVVDSPQAV